MLTCHFTVDWEIPSVSAICLLLMPLTMSFSTCNSRLLNSEFGGRWAIVHRPANAKGSHIWLSFSPDLKHWGDSQVLLTARSDPVDVVLGLEAGADDYVTKPFEPAVLAARLRAVLRRVARHDASPLLRIDELEIDRAGMQVRVAGEPIGLTPTEYRLLLELAEHFGVFCSRERLLEEVWGYVWAGDTRLVDMHVRRLRAKVGADVIETVRGAGYKLVRR